MSAAVRRFASAHLLPFYAKKTWMTTKKTNRVLDALKQMSERHTGSLMEESYYKRPLSIVIT